MYSDTNANANIMPHLLMLQLHVLRLVLREVRHRALATVALVLLSRLP